MEQGAAIAENATNIEVATRPEQPPVPPQPPTESPETEQPAVTEIGIVESSDDELELLCSYLGFALIVFSSQPHCQARE
eukprot:COSAG05_NODE_1630_length_4372_cov_1.241282_1_plen_79_part_00